MKLSELREGDAGRFTDVPGILSGFECQKFVVTYRSPYNYSSRVSRIITADGKSYEFTLNYNDPEIEKIGTGEVRTEVIITEDDGEI